MAHHHHGVESTQARSEAPDGGVALPLGGVQPQIFTARVDGRGHRPAWGVTRHHRLRLHGDGRRDERRVTVRAGARMAGAPGDFEERCPPTGAVPRARDALQGAGPAAIPCHGQMGALGRVRHDRLGGRAWPALHAWTPERAGRARWRRLIQGGSAITLAAHPRGLAGAVAAIPDPDDLARRKPADQAGPQQPGAMCRRSRARPRGLRPRGATIPGAQERTCPGPDRERQRDRSRQHDPRMPPPIRRIAMGRAPARAMPSLAADVGARTFGTRIIARQEYRARRDDLVQENREQQASQRPGGPSAW